MPQPNVIPQMPSPDASDGRFFLTHFARDSAAAAPERGDFFNPRDGSLLRLIPAGECLLGSTPAELEAARQMDHDGPLFALRHESPQFRAFVPAFYLGVQAVTNAQFARFLTETGASPEEFSHWLTPAQDIRQSRGGLYEAERGHALYPAIHVSWFGAAAYCRWAGLRLPTEIEWEKAARGPDGRVFPWGDDWDEHRLRWHGGERADDETTAPVDAFAAGASPYGLLQMAGNVDDQSRADPYQPDVYPRYARGDLRLPANGYGRVVRGGTCLRRNKLEFRCAMRRSNAPAWVNILYTGLRCARDATPMPGPAHPPKETGIALSELRAAPAERFHPLGPDDGEFQPCPPRWPS